VVRVRENYHSGLLLGNDNKMNGALNSEAASRKTLRTVDFGPHALLLSNALAWVEFAG